MAGINTNRTTAGVILPPEVSNEIWQDTQNESVIQRLAQKVSLPGSGITIQTITGDPVAEWVDETDEKPVGESTFGQKSMTPYKAAIIELFSDEFRRDKAALFSALQTRLPGALAKLFDQAVLFGPAPGSNFDTLASVPTASINTAGSVYSGLLGALSSVATVGKADITSWALAPQAEIKVLGELDGDNRPLFTMNPQQDGAIGSLLGRPVYKNGSVYKAAGGVGTKETLGFAGDWSSARWGTVEGIKISVTDQATINKGGTSINLWQRNMFAVRVEVEFGFIVRDTNRFVRLTGVAGA
jgi:HK97 family phage major capsid protein